MRRKAQLVVIDMKKAAKAAFFILPNEKRQARSATAGSPFLARIRLAKRRNR